MVKIHEIRLYWRESRRFRDFFGMLQVRLSKSKIGPIVCPRPIATEVDLVSLGRGVLLRSHTTDISVLGELLVAGSYEPLLKAVEGEPAFIVDLGANTGLAARLFLERFPKAQIICVEPEMGNVVALQSNLSSYGDRATVVAAAIGGRARHASLARGRGEFGFRIVEADGSADPAVVQVVTMDSLLAGVPDTIDLLKCDVEGAEQELFESCSSWLPHTRLASVECHHPYTQRDLLSALRANGVDVDVVTSESTPEFGCDSIVFRIVRELAGRRSGP